MEIEEKPHNSLYHLKLDEMLQKEKIARQQNNVQELFGLLSTIIKFAFDAKEYDSMFEQLINLSKKRGQNKKALIEMVRMTMGMIDQISEQQIRIQLIQTLKSVCDKKIYLEVEYARCCLLMVKHKENEDNINEAAKILQDVQVETYGSMKKREKVDFILYQMKIMIKKKDFIRLYIISKKINRTSIEDDEEIQDLKVIYYSYMVIYYNHENENFEAFLCYKKIFETLLKHQELQQQMPKQIEFNFNIEEKVCFENMILFLSISQYTPEYVTAINSLSQQFRIQLENYQQLKNVITQLQSTELISANPTSYNILQMEIFQPNFENYDKHQSQFQKNLIHHNIRILSLYYDQIYMNRMVELVGASFQVVEDELCYLINQKIVNAVIDRVVQIVSFKVFKSENQQLNEWIFDSNKILDLLDRTSKLIVRENEVNKISK